MIIKASKAIKPQQIFFFQNWNQNDLRSNSTFTPKITFIAVYRRFLCKVFRTGQFPIRICHYIHYAMIDLHVSKTLDATKFFKALDASWLLYKGFYFFICPSFFLASVTFHQKPSGPANNSLIMWNQFSITLYASRYQHIVRSIFS